MSSCVNDVMNSVWWGDHSSNAGDAFEIGLWGYVTGLGFLSIPAAAFVGLVSILIKMDAKDAARYVCELYLCKSSYAQTCSCCKGPWNCDYWTCSCSGTGKLYPGGEGQWYEFEPSGAATKVRLCV